MAGIVERREASHSHSLMRGKSQLAKAARPRQESPWVSWPRCAAPSLAAPAGDSPARGEATRRRSRSRERAHSAVHSFSASFAA